MGLLSEAHRHIAVPVAQTLFLTTTGSRPSLRRHSIGEKPAEPSAAVRIIGRPPPEIPILHQLKQSAFSAAEELPENPRVELCRRFGEALLRKLFPHSGIQLYSIICITDCFCDYRGD